MAREAAAALDKYEEEILNAPFVEYSKDNPPSYLKFLVEGGVKIDGLAVRSSHLTLGE
jgi:hypothetical protein